MTKECNCYLAAWHNKKKTKNTLSIINLKMMIDIQVLGREQGEGEGGGLRLKNLLD